MPVNADLYLPFFPANVLVGSYVIVSTCAAHFLAAQIAVHFLRHFLHPPRRLLRLETAGSTAFTEYPYSVLEPNFHSLEVPMLPNLRLTSLPGLAARLAASPPAARPYPTPIVAGLTSRTSTASFAPPFSSVRNGSVPSNGRVTIRTSP